MKKIRLLIAEKDEKLKFFDILDADTILRETDVPSIYRVSKSRYTNKAGRLVQIKDWK